MLKKTYFDLFGLPVAFNIDRPLLDSAYRQLQAEIHPDRFAAASDQERLRSLQLATDVNEAYQTLKSPLSRARYLLQLNGVDTREESNTAMPAAFLMRQMEWREAIEEAVQSSDLPSLEKLGKELRHEESALQDSLAIALDHNRDYQTACDSVRKLRFLDKVQAEIEQALEMLEE